MERKNADLNQNGENADLNPLAARSQECLKNAPLCRTERFASLESKLLNKKCQNTSFFLQKKSVFYVDLKSKRA